jgi:hypothetical protein
MGKKPFRAAAIEGVRWYFAEDRPRGAPPKPFLLTYAGDDVVEIPGVGKFQNGTTAEVDAETARACEGRPEWIVRERPRAAEGSEDEEAPR